MTVYLMGFREKLRDPEEMKLYSQKARKADNSKAKGLAVYGKMETWEGAAPEAAFLVEFPTMEDAKAWYNSSEYTEARQHRHKGSDYRIVVIEGV